MKKWLVATLLFVCGFCDLSVKAHELPRRSEYVIVTSYRVSNDIEWMDVIEALKKKHKGAEVCYYKESPREVLPNLRGYYPRYVAFIEKPEQIGRDFIVDLNRMSREIDDDIYADYLWGVITGYDAKAALRLVNGTTESKVLKSALSTVGSFGDGLWFERFAYISDSRPGICGEREKGEAKIKEEMVTDSIDNRMFRDMVDKAEKGNRKLDLPGDFSVKKPNLLKRFCDFYAEYDPDLIVTAAHATERNLEMPYSAGNIMCKGGKLYADFPDGPKDLVESGKTRVYLPIGNCLMGNVNKTSNSMAIAFMNSANVGMLIGYVVETWYGRNGWGGLCYFMNNPGRYTIPEAFYLNQQDMLFQLREMAPDFLRKPYPYKKENMYHLEQEYSEVAKTYGKGKVPVDVFGFYHDRDALALYGDPAWDVRLMKQENPNDYEVKCKVRNEECVITVKTGPDYSGKRLEGSDFRSQHVGDLPFSYFFPKRLRNPRLAEGQNWKTALDENFLLVYKPDFEPNKEYTIILRTDPIR